MSRFVLVAAALLALGAGSALAQVADTDAMMAADVVGARKAVMGAIGAQTGVLRGAVEANDLAAAKTAGATIAALAGALPPLFAEVHAGAYPVAGSKYRFAGGDLEQFVAGVMALHAAARAAATAESTSAIEVRAIYGACSSCHGTFRR